MIVAEAILTIVCFPLMNVLILLEVVLCNSVLSLHCSIFMEVVSVEIDLHVSCTKSILSIANRLLLVSTSVY